MTIRSLITVLLIIGPAAATAQISGDFYLEKSTYAPGEPVFLYFNVVNHGPSAEYIRAADPYTFCSGYQITVSSDPHATDSCGNLPVGGSCFSSSKVLSPGKPDLERILLNFDHDIRIPGEYSVEAAHTLDHSGSGSDFFNPAIPKTSQEVKTTLHFRVDQDATPANISELQPWLDQLQSKDPVARTEAARTLASLAPASLEDTLLAFADNPEFRQFAPLAFHRLNTPRSMEALAELLEKTNAGTFEHMKSADYLAESDDQQWFPLLRDVAERHAQIASYVDDGAELGGDKMLPSLITLAGDPDREFTAVNAVTAMGSTGSRAAVPLLLDFLQNPDPGIADRARYALRLLTHRTASKDTNESPQSEYSRWENWWETERQRCSHLQAYRLRQLYSPEVGSPDHFSCLRIPSG